MYEVNMSKVTLRVKDYTLEPFGRYETDGEGNGEVFRKEYILPELKKGNDIIIDLDGVNDGYGSSFLVEAFANLIRKEEFTYGEIKRRIKFESKNEHWLKEIDSYLDAARGNSSNMIGKLLNWK